MKNNHPLTVRQLAAWPVLIGLLAVAICQEVGILIFNVLTYEIWDY